MSEDRLIAALILLCGVCMCVGVLIGYKFGQQSITPGPVPTIAGQHCWQEWNPTQPQSHELICQAN